jgi:hypothetical protein
MKVICVYNKGNENFLTIDKMYDVIRVFGDEYEINNNEDDYHYYDKECFISQSKIRNDMINELLE